eukprot:gene8181-12607_t
MVPSDGGKMVQRLDPEAIGLDVSPRHTRAEKRAARAALGDHIERYKWLFGNEALSDVQLQLGPDPQDLLPAHKAVLSTHSTTFRAMFGSPSWAENSQQVVSMPYPKPTCLCVLLHIYCCDAPLDQETLPDVLDAATYYDLDGLIEAVIDKMKQTLSHAPVLPYLQAALMFGETSLRDACVAYLRRTNAMADLFYDKAFLSVSPEVADVVVSEAVIDTELNMLVRLRDDPSPAPSTPLQGELGASCRSACGASPLSCTEEKDRCNGNNNNNKNSNNSNNKNHTNNSSSNNNNNNNKNSDDGSAPPSNASFPSDSGGGGNPAVEAGAAPPKPGKPGAPAACGHLTSPASTAGSCTSSSAPSALGGSAAVSPDAGPCGHAPEATGLSPVTTLPADRRSSAGFDGPSAAAPESCSGSNKDGGGFPATRRSSDLDPVPSESSSIADGMPSAADVSPARVASFCEPSSQLVEAVDTLMSRFLKFIDFSKLTPDQLRTVEARRLVSPAALYGIFRSKALNANSAFPLVERRGGIHLRWDCTQSRATALGKCDGHLLRAADPADQDPPRWAVRCAMNKFEAGKHYFVFAVKKLKVPHDSFVGVAPARAPPDCDPATVKAPGYVFYEACCNRVHAGAGGFVTKAAGVPPSSETDPWDEIGVQLDFAAGAVSFHHHCSGTLLYTVQYAALPAPLYPCAALLHPANDGVTLSETTTHPDSGPTHSDQCERCGQKSPPKPAKEK